MDTLIQSVSATLDSTVAGLKPQNNSYVRGSVNIATNMVDGIINWVAAHPRTALAITIFALGFIAGLLF